MREVARGLWLLESWPPHAVNVYLMGDVLVDGATRWHRSRLLRQLGGRRPRLVALTHCHPDHQGVVKFFCDRYRIPLACHAADAPAAEGRAPMVPHNWIVCLGVRTIAGPPCPVGRVLADGDEVAGFRAVHTPGHTPGHLIFFRESDGVAVAGDLLANINFLTGKAELREPPWFFSADQAENRRSVQVLAALRPSVACFGHGPPLRDPDALQRAAEQLLRRPLPRRFRG
jgi:glyoxylase-like metal-dependent hydrolase (beta-lactamase superfamily II)